MALAKVLFGISSSFPPEEKFGLSTQIRRAAVSVPANVAEGHARGSTKDFLRFLSISMGSLAEVETLLLLSRELNLVSQDSLDSTLRKTGEIGRMLRGLQKSLRRKLSESKASPQFLVPSP